MQKSEIFVLPVSRTWSPSTSLSLESACSVLTTTFCNLQSSPLCQTQTWLKPANNNVPVIIDLMNFVYRLFLKNHFKNYVYSRTEYVWNVFLLWVCRPIRSLKRDFLNLMECTPLFVNHSKTNRLLSVEHNHYSLFWYSYMLPSVFFIILGLLI